MYGTKPPRPGLQSDGDVAAVHVHHVGKHLEREEGDTRRQVAPLYGRDVQVCESE